MLVVLLQFSNLRPENIKFLESNDLFMLFELTELLTQFVRIELRDKISFEDLYDGLLGCLQQKDLLE